MGPQKKEEFGTSRLERVRQAALKTVKIYFERPAYYLFYIALTGLIFGLPLGADFPTEYYVVLGILAIPEVYNYFKKK